MRISNINYDNFYMNRNKSLKIQPVHAVSKQTNNNQMDTAKQESQRNKDGFAEILKQEQKKYK